MEVSTRFRIIDQATPALEKMAREMTELSKLADTTRKELESIGKPFGALSGAEFVELNKQLAKIVTAAPKAGKGVADFTVSVLDATKAVIGLNAELATAAAEMLRIDGGIGTAIADTKLLATEWANVAAAMTTASRAAAGSMAHASPFRLGGRTGGGVGGVHVSSIGVPLPGGLHARAGFGGNNMALAGAGALAYGVYEQGELEDQIVRILATANANQVVAKEVYKGQHDRLENIIKDAASKTGMPFSDLSEAAHEEMRMFAGAMTPEQRMAVLPHLLEQSAAEARLRGEGTSTKQAMDSFIGLAHMAKFYKPEEIAELSRKFSFLSIASPATMKQTTNAASYGAVLQELGYDPFDTMLGVTALQRAGAYNSKSGTWERELAKRALPENLKTMSEKEYKEKEPLYRQLGLMDSNLHATFLDAKRHASFMKLLDILSVNIEKIPERDRGGVLSKLLGTQGASAAALLADPKVVTQLHELKEKMDNFGSGEAFFEQYKATSPVQQGRVAWTDLQKVLMDLGEIVLPPVVGLLQGMDEALKAIDANFPSWLKGDFMKAVESGAGQGAVIGAGAGALVGRPGAGAIVGGALGAIEGIAQGAIQKNLGQKPEDLPSYPWNYNFLRHNESFIEGGDDNRTALILGAIGNCLGQSYDVQLAMRADLDALAMGGGISPASWGGRTMPDTTPAAHAAVHAAMRSTGAAGRLASLPPAGLGVTDGATGGALSVAIGHLGQTERGDTGKLSSFFASAGLHLNPAFTAWCAAFVNSSLAAAGIKGTGSLAADSFKHWGMGVASDALQAGDILVKNIHGRYGHVGIFDGNRRGDMLEMIAGNSHDRVEREWVPAGNYLGRRAIHYKDSNANTTPPAPINIQIAGKTLARISSEEIAKHHSFPTQAPYSDGRRGFWSPDQNICST